MKGNWSKSQYMYAGSQTLIIAYGITVQVLALLYVWDKLDFIESFKNTLKTKRQQSALRYD